jgi:photosystem II stability/assembly factor-like uncharacterized protein
MARILTLCLIASIGLLADAHGQRSTTTLDPTPSSERLTAASDRQTAANNSWTSGLPLRCVGPTIMSGRVSDIAVAPGDGSEFYVAYASGGLWHTLNNGTSFEPLFDQALSITLGAVALHAETQRLWAGTGEVNSSRSSYAGTGIYISDDQGDTWEHRGLEDTQHIGRIELHPTNGDIAWVAALGPLYSKNTSGGVYRTLNGGLDWTCVLAIDGLDNRAGAVDLILDPSDSNHLFASTWDRTRRAWNFTGNGPGSGIWESRDGGDTWIELSALDGFPNLASTGRIGLAWHPGAQQLFAFVDNQAALPDSTSTMENESQDYEATLFRDLTVEEFAVLDTAKLERFLEDNDFPESDDATSLFQRIAERTLHPSALHDYLTDGNKALFEADIVGTEVYRLGFLEGQATSWNRTHSTPLEDVGYTYGYYFGMIEVDPNNADRLWIAGVPLIESVDGGATWKSLGAPNVHVDHHHLWANPAREGHLINGNDGGVNISWDGGENWIKCNSPAVGQFYAIEVDNAEPYNIYGGLQDNGTWVGPSNYRYSKGWHQRGKYPWEELSGGDGMQIEVDPRNPEVVFTGSQFGWYNRIDRQNDDYTSLHPKHELGETPLRWNWQTPIWLSRHQPDILYMASNRLHRSFDQGENWETLSTDLTRGGRSGNVPFGTITSLHESPLRFGQLAVGTDDGLIQISRDGGNTWNALTSPIPQNTKRNELLWVSEVLWSHHHEQRLYVALNGYRLDHFDSWIFMTENDGRTWTRLGGNDLPCEPVNALAESASREGTLFAGTDGGAYVSFNDGSNWSAIHPDLPAVPVHDLVIQERENELVIGTHGRSIWVLELDAMWKHWDASELWSDAIPAAFVLSEIETIEFDEQWGERGWSWSEPRDVTADVDAFSPEPITAHWVITNDSTETTWIGDTIQLLRGWQSLSIPLKLQTSPEVEFIQPGSYTVSLHTDSATPLATSSLLIGTKDD